MSDRDNTIVDRLEIFVWTEGKIFWSQGHKITKNYRDKTMAKSGAAVASWHGLDPNWSRLVAPDWHRRWPPQVCRPPPQRHVWARPMSRLDRWPTVCSHPQCPWRKVLRSTQQCCASHWLRERRPVALSNVSPASGGILSPGRPGRGRSAVNWSPPSVNLSPGLFPHLLTC